MKKWKLQTTAILLGGFFHVEADVSADHHGAGF